MSTLHLVLSTEQTDGGTSSKFITDLACALPGSSDEWLAGIDSRHWKVIKDRLITLGIDGLPRTIWIATQNPFVMDLFKFTSPEDFQARVWLWREGSLRQVTEDHAQTFFASYDVGIQHVSELLRLQGLW